MTLIAPVNENNYHSSEMDDDAQAKAILAGTLALMTQFAESQIPGAAQGIQRNLLLLSSMEALPWEFRAALAKLGARWSLLEAARARTAGKSTLH